jgi:hypothetical protein
MTLRVLHGPVNIGNQPWSLSRQERALGIRSDLVVNYSTWLGYPSDRCLGTYQDRSRSAISRRLWFGLTAPFRYQVLHYYFGRSFLCWDDYGPRNRMWFTDLRLAKRLGRRVFMTLQGCDARISSESSRRSKHTMCNIGECSAAEICRSTLDQERRFLIDRVLPLADRVLILNPELAHYVPSADFVPYANVDIDSFEPRLPGGVGPVRILHAPSDPAIKGTRYIRAAIERLKTRHEIEYLEVTGIAHSEALEMYRQADLVIDQVLAGWYGGLAVEVMAMGKPVACFIRDQDLDVLPAGMRAELPVIRLTPDTIESDLDRALAERSLFAELGRRSRAYVERWHHPRRIASALIRLSEDPAGDLNL